LKARPADAEIQGFYCPLQPAHLVARRLQSGKCILSDLGLEKECPKCKCFWPMDTEYWFASRTEDGLFGWCRACYTERRWPNRGAPRPAHQRSPIADLTFRPTPELELELPPFHTPPVQPIHYEALR